MKKLLILFLILIGNCSEKKQSNNLIKELSFEASQNTPLLFILGDITHEPSKTPYKEGSVFSGWKNELGNYNFDLPIFYSQSLKPSFEILDSHDEFKVGEVEEAKEWNEAFSRTWGWLGGDGIFTMTLDGVDIPGQGVENGKKVLFWFSDSISGNVENGKTNMTSFVNNSMAWTPYNGKPKDIQWYYEPGSTRLKTIFSPKNPNNTEKQKEIFWVNDGFINHERNNEATFFVLNTYVRPGEGIWGFEGVKNSVLTVQNDSLPPKKIKYEEHALDLDAKKVGFMAGLLVNTKEAGIKNGDGYIYIYFTHHANYTFDTRIGRVLPKDVLDSKKYSFWNGSDWGSAEESIVVTTGVSAEMSVVQLADGKYMMTFQEDCLGKRIGIKISNSPTNWSSQTIWIYDIKLEDPDMISYNTKAHPALSKKDEIIISYNTNIVSNDEEKLKRFSHKLHPYFIRLKLK
jgi:hypothetical protein